RLLNKFSCFYNTEENIIKKVILVSFFKSNNLGDIAISSTIEKILINEGCNVSKFDYQTVSSIKKNSKKTSVEDKQIFNKILKRILIIFKKFFLKVFGVNFMENIYFFYQIFFTSKWRKFHREIRESDALVLAGGNMIMDINNSFSLPNWATIFSTYCKLATRNNKDIYISFIVAGPIKHEHSKRIYGSALNSAKQITVRDPISKEVCESITKSNVSIRQTVDPVFALAPNMLEYRVLQQRETSKFKVGICAL